MPVQPGPSIQIFGLADSRATQAALRFFKERRVNVVFVDSQKGLREPTEGPNHARDGERQHH